jgi:hypothetical protein
MFVSVVQFDEVLHVHRNEANQNMPRHTVFSFMSQFKYTPYVSVPGFPRLEPGMRVVALLREQDNWKTLVGWRDLETGALATPDVRYHVHHLISLLVGLAGVAWLTTGERFNLPLMIPVLLFGVFGLSAVLELKAARRAHAETVALQELPNAA